MKNLVKKAFVEGFMKESGPLISKFPDMVMNSMRKNFPDKYKNITMNPNRWAKARDKARYLMQHGARTPVEAAEKILEMVK